MTPLAREVQRRCCVLAAALLRPGRVRAPGI